MVATLNVNQPLLRLTRHPSGSLGEVVFLSLPIMFVLLSGALLGFVERIILANYSLETLGAFVSAIYLCRLFQLPCIGLALFAQIFVATYLGAKQLNRIGGCVWQMIWFSVLSMILTLPLSYIIGPLFFSGTQIEQTGSQYFYILAAVNFFYPLSAALSSFYLGQGKARFIVIGTVFAHLLNVGLDIVLIFGYKDWIPALGIKGAALATILSQGIFCLILFALFMQKEHRNLYGINNWAFNPSECWKYLKVGLPRAVAKIIILGIGTATCRIMVTKGNDHLMVLSIGFNIVAALSFLGDGIHQAMLTLVSHLAGANQLHLRQKILESAFRFMGVLGILLMIPLFFFPEVLLGFFFQEPPEENLQRLLHATLHWIWFHMMGYISVCIFLGFILSLKDALFYMITACLTVLTSFLPIYLAMNHWGWSPDKFWIITSMEGTIISIIYFLRLRQSRWNHFNAVTFQAEE